MAVEPEDDELLLDKEQGEGGNADEQDQEEQEQSSNEPGELGGDEEEDILIGDEAAPASGERETGLIKHLREELRRQAKENAELRKSVQAPQAIEVGERPTLESCEWDEERYAASVEAWMQRKAAADRQQTEAQQQNRAVEEAWQADVKRFEARKSELKVPDAEEAIETAMAGLNQVQQAVIVKAADNPALVFAALGKHPGKLAEIASIQDPLKQAAAVAKLEGKLTVAPRRRPPEPEQIASGNARVTQGKDKTLERLEAEAERTGDRSKIAVYKRQQKQQAKA